ncbi:MAG: hypothetical protein QM757_17690 [Paludibaculum sp.]
MDIFAHSLATAAVVVFVNRKAGPRVHLGWAVFFGVFPDLASFTVPAALRIWWWVTGVTATLLPQPGGPRLDWVFGLYHCVHSLLIFGLCFAAAWILVGKPIWALLGWLLHIGIDILTHRGWFAIQALWPLSPAHFDGIPWERGWLLAATYTALAAVFFVLWRTRVRPSGLADAHGRPRGVGFP